MANLHPELGRMASFFETGKLEAGHNSRVRALGIVDNILASGEINSAGREEWNVIKNFILGFEHLDGYEKKILSKYAEPFAFKFMNSYATQNRE